jgi:hypothetical protein
MKGWNPATCCPNFVMATSTVRYFTSMYVREVAWTTSKHPMTSTDAIVDESSLPKCRLIGTSQQFLTLMPSEVELQQSLPRAN